MEVGQPLNKDEPGHMLPVKARAQGLWQQGSGLPHAVDVLGFNDRVIALKGGDQGGMAPGQNLGGC